MICPSTYRSFRGNATVWVIRIMYYVWIWCGWFSYFQLYVIKKESSQTAARIETT